MDNPELARNTSSYARFKELAHGFTSNPVRKVGCWVVANKEEAMLWIERRHINRTDGIGIDRWGPLAQARYEKEHLGKVRKEIAVLAALFEKKKLPESVIEQLHDRRLSIVQRLVKTSEFSSYAKATINNDGSIVFNGISEDDGLDKLADFAQAIADNPKKYNTRTMNIKEKRKEFLASIFGPIVDEPEASSGGTDASSESKPGTSPTDEQVSPPTHPPGSKATSLSPPVKTSPTGKRPKPKSEDRDNLAPKDGHRTFHISNPRINNIYWEARTIDVEAFKQCASFLVRVFLELSTDAYLEGKCIQHPKGLPWVEQKLERKN